MKVDTHGPSFASNDVNWQDPTAATSHTRPTPLWQPQKSAFRTNDAPLLPLVMATTRMGAGLQHPTVTATVTSRRDPLTTNMANDNAKTMATNPTSLEAGHRRWATPATFVGEAGRNRGR